LRPITGVPSSRNGWFKDTFVRFFSSKVIVFSCLVIFLFLPLFFHGTRCGIPYVKGGDEPHYLIMINTLIETKNWDVKKSYEEVWKGSTLAGKKYAGLPLDAHANYIVPGKILPWSGVYENPSIWKKDSEGQLVPLLKPGIDDSTLRACPGHPYGMAFLLASILWPFKNTPWVEPLALLFANLSVLLSVFLFRRLIRRYVNDSLIVNLSTFIVFLCTPLWAYGRTLFNEPFLILFGLVGYLAALDKKSGFWSGLFLGIGLFMKPTFCILLFPLGIHWLLRKDWGNILRMAVGPALALAFYLYTNNELYGSPYHFYDHKDFGDTLQGMFGLCFSWNHGLLPFLPVVIPVLFFWKRFLREKGEEAWVLGGAVILNYFFWANIVGDWYGGWCYGPRQMVPVIPFLMIPIFYALESYHSWKKWQQWVFVILCLLSFSFNALGAMDGYWDSHPLTILKGNVS